MVVNTRGKTKKSKTIANNVAPPPTAPAVGGLRDEPNEPTFGQAIQEAIPYIDPILKEKNPGSKSKSVAKTVKKPAGGKTTAKKSTTKKSKTTKEPTTKKATTTTKGKRKPRADVTTKNKVVQKQAKKNSTDLENNNNEETTQPSASVPSISSLSLQLQVVELKLDKLYNKLKKSLKVKRSTRIKSTKSNNSPRHQSRKHVVNIAASRTTDNFSDVEVFDVKKPSVGQYLPPKDCEFRLVCVHVSFLYLLFNFL